MMKSSKDWSQTWSKPIKIADPCVSHNNLGRSMSLQNYNRFKEALKLQKKELKRLKETFLNESAATSPSRFFQELLWMFKYSFESTGVHPCLSSKINQIVINRDELIDHFENLNLSHGESAQTMMQSQNQQDHGNYMASASGAASGFAGNLTDLSPIKQPQYNEEENFVFHPP